MWLVRIGGDDVELRPWHYIYVYSIESRLIMRNPKSTSFTIYTHRSLLLSLE